MRSTQKRKEGELIVLYELPAFEHADAESVREAVLWLEKWGNQARVIAGGTDLLGLMKDRLEGPQLKTPQVLINVKHIAEMKRIDHDDESGLRIGAAVTLNQLGASDIIRERFSILSQAARQIGTTQIRNMGTLGGNLCQRPQCLYFRHPDFPCYKKGGRKCYAVSGEHRYDHSVINYGKCVVAHPSDMAPALIALNAGAIIATSNGERKLPLQDFFLSANDYTETALKPGELLVALRVPDKGSKTNQLFLKHRVRHASDFALASVAVVAEMSERIVQDIRIVMGGIAPYPYIADGTGAMVNGKELDPKLILQVAEASIDGARPLPRNGYKIDLAKALVKRALESIRK
ncbi:MAG: xanthine dehydrogenase family protein subunit M [Desulfobacterales bacterium]|jgi:xanthine dehydrogenase YagS FAD-binding subunit|nr:xanthine dehydrogenase family protein subunit M [Desulfobacterales bacterium]